MSYKELRKRLPGVGLALVLLVQLAACAGGGTNTVTTNFPVVVFSDVHFDPFYDHTRFHDLVTSEATQWESIFKTSGISSPSTPPNDTNYPLFILALSGIEQNMGTSPFVIFTGDILSHRFAQTFYSLNGSASPPSDADVAAMKAFADKTVAFFTMQMRASVGNIPVMFAVGNNDSYADLGPDSSFLSNNAESFYTFLSGTVDHQTFITTFEHGGYYSAEPPGTNLMVLGLDTVVFCTPPPGVDTRSAVTAELSWFDTTLASASARGKKVWLLMHVPPGANVLSTAEAFDANVHITSAAMMWEPGNQTNFLQILAKYPGLITLKLAGHTHMDEYRIMSQVPLEMTSQNVLEMTSQNVLEMTSQEVLEMTPSISPRSGNDPAFKVLAVSPDTMRVMDYTSLNYDLGTMPAQFSSYYTFSTVYSMQGPLDDSLTQLYPALVTDGRKQALYRTHYFSGRPYTGGFNPITGTNWPVFRCGIGHMDQQRYTDCVNSL